MSDTFNTTPANWQGVDDEPTNASNNLVKSSGVESELLKRGIFDISLYNNTTYANLQDALTALAALPTSFWKRGMNIKFSDSTLGKYVQYRYVNPIITINTLSNPDYWTNATKDVAEYKEKVIDSLFLNYQTTLGHTINITDKITWRRGYIRKATGEFVENSSYYSTYLIPICGSITKEITLTETNSGNGTLNVAFYDVNHEFIGYEPANDVSNEQVNVLLNAYYVAFTTTNKTTFSVDFTSAFTTYDIEDLEQEVKAKRKGSLSYNSSIGVQSGLYASIIDLSFNKNIIFNKLQVRAINTGTLSILLINESSVTLVEEITKNVSEVGTVEILPSDFSFDFDNISNECKYGIYVGSANERIVAYSVDAVNDKAKSFRKADSEQLGGVYLVNTYRPSIVFDYELKDWSDYFQRIEDTEHFVGQEYTELLQEYINSHSICNLGPQIFRVNDSLTIPNGTIIRGVRGKTVIESLTNYSGALITFNSSAKDIQIENITFKGSSNPITQFTANLSNVRSRLNVGTVCGILINGTAQSIHIKDCDFFNFSLAGIKLIQTLGDMKIARTVKITDCDFNGNYYGLLLDVRAEFHSVVGCNFSFNQIGCFVEGGNNYLSNCHFDKNKVGFVASGTANNNDTHGCVSNSSFNHNSNAAVMCVDTKGGFAFGNCMFYESGIYISASRGININGGTVGCTVFMDSVIENVYNMIQNCIFVDAYSSGPMIVGDSSYLSLKNNRLKNSTDYSSINNNM